MTLESKNFTEPESYQFDEIKGYFALKGVFIPTPGFNTQVPEGIAKAEVVNNIEHEGTVITEIAVENDLLDAMRAVFDDIIQFLRGKGYWINEEPGEKITKIIFLNQSRSATKLDVPPPLVMFWIDQTDLAILNKLEEIKEKLSGRWYYRN